MNEKQAEQMLTHLKRIESLLEAIDWKVWNFHQKVLGEGVSVETAAGAEDEETEQLAAVIETPRRATPQPTANKNAYPSIEKWS
jgi:hypothetical protein